METDTNVDLSNLRKLMKDTSVSRYTAILGLCILLQSCLSTDKKEPSSSIIGDWINIGFTNNNYPLVYNFRENNVLYTTYLDGNLSERTWRLEGKEIMISSDTNRSFFQRYLVEFARQNDTLLLHHQDGKTISLTPASELKLSNFPVSDVEEVLVEGFWQMSFVEDQEEDREIEFLRNGKGLFTYDSIKKIHSSTFSWSVHNVDSILCIVLEDYRNHLIILEELSADFIVGRLYDSVGSHKVFHLKRMGNRDSTIEANSLVGSWSLITDTKGTDIPVIIDFESEDGFMGYFTKSEDKSVISIGSWEISKSGDVIILDQIKQGSRGIMTVINLRESNLMIEYDGNLLSYAKVKNSQ